MPEDIRTRKHMHIRVRGKVQGVTYHAAAKKVADSLGVTGYIQNNPDGSVTLEAEGDAYTLHEFLDWCSIGTNKSKVDRIDVEEGGLQYFDQFSIEE